MSKSKNSMGKDGRCLAIALVGVLIGTLFVTDVYSGVNMNVASCSGWECGEVGSLCAPDKPGANGHTYMCDGNQWKELPNVIIAKNFFTLDTWGFAVNPRTDYTVFHADSCSGWRCGEQGQSGNGVSKYRSLCLPDRPGANGTTYVCGIDPETETGVNAGLGAWERVFGRWKEVPSQVVTAEVAREWWTRAWADKCAKQGGGWVANQDPPISCEAITAMAVTNYNHTVDAEAWYLDVPCFNPTSSGPHSRVSKLLDYPVSSGWGTGTGVAGSDCGLDP